MLGQRGLSVLQTYLVWQFCDPRLLGARAWPNQCESSELDGERARF